MTIKTTENLNNKMQELTEINYNLDAKIQFARAAIFNGGMCTNTKNLFTSVGRMKYYFVNKSIYKQCGNWKNHWNEYQFTGRIHL